MRYRSLSPSGDYVFGSGRSEFLVNSPSTVGQAVKTRLALMTGEWFLNTEDGTPYATQILGTGTTTLYDQAIQERILETQGVTSIKTYVSVLDRQTRNLAIDVLINTVYGEVQVTTNLGL